MHSLKTTASLVMTLALLSGCAQTPEPPKAVVEPAQTALPDHRKTLILKKLAPHCGTPTEWTPEQMIAVADTIEKHADEPGMELLSPEWERLNNAVKICRTGASK